jgi:hypothetical protein
VPDAVPTTLTRTSTRRPISNSSLGSQWTIARPCGGWDESNAKRFAHVIKVEHRMLLGLIDFLVAVGSIEKLWATMTEMGRADEPRDLRSSGGLRSWSTDRPKPPRNRRAAFWIFTFLRARNDFQAGRCVSNQSARKHRGLTGVAWV